MSGRMKPSTRPEMPRPGAEYLLIHAGVKGPAILGRRGYYRDSMGKPGVNERGIYDDAILVVTPTAYATFNANCDPSRYEHGIANLKAGLWTYKLGIHGLSRPAAKRYKALVQAAPVTVLRDGGKEETGWFGINIHKGGFSTTGSLGCQTIHPEQWEAFYYLVASEMARHGLNTIPYLLTEREEMPA